MLILHRSGEFRIKAIIKIAPLEGGKKKRKKKNLLPSNSYVATCSKQSNSSCIALKSNSNLPCSLAYIQPKTYSIWKRTACLRKGLSIHTEKTSDNVGSSWLSLHSTGETEIFIWIIIKIWYFPHTLLIKVSTFCELSKYINFINLSTGVIFGSHIYQSQTFK